jgi:glycosyltransferase involved in cell wall biosynthesis
MYSLIIPVFKNEESLPDVLRVIKQLHCDLHNQLEVVFVIDGSPDQSSAWLHTHLPSCKIPTKVVELSRNFGSFAAIRAGLIAGSGPYFAMMAADLQEPPSLILDMFSSLASDTCDVAIGTREARSDPLLNRVFSGIFWALYRRLVQRDMPSGGVDMFACNTGFRDQLVALPESNSSLVGLMFWIGFRRTYISYKRAARQKGRSAWTLRKKFRYVSNSVFAFSDLPIQIFLFSGMIGILAAVVLGAFVFGARLTGLIDVPGYATTVLLILFFAALNSLGLGVLGSYTWRAFENTKLRPISIVMRETSYGER